MAVVAVPFILYLVRFCSPKPCKPGTKGPLVQVLHEAILPLDFVEGIGLPNVLNPPQEHP